MASENVKALTDADFGESVKKGVVLVDFWATWCGPCVKEMPNLKRLYEAYKGKGFDIVAVSIDHDGDLPARYGGEEFAVILPGTPLAAAKPIAERIRTTLAARKIVRRNTGEALGGITISVGAALYRPGETAAALVARADSALYAAKHRGRNRLVTETDAAG